MLYLEEVCVAWHIIFTRVWSFNKLVKVWHIPEEMLVWNIFKKDKWIKIRYLQSGRSWRMSVDVKWNAFGIALSMNYIWWNVDFNSSLPFKFFKIKNSKHIHLTYIKEMTSCLGCIIPVLWVTWATISPHGAGSPLILLATSWHTCQAFFFHALGLHTVYFSRLSFWISFSVRLSSALWYCHLIVDPSTNASPAIKTNTIL